MTLPCKFKNAKASVICLLNYHMENFIFLTFFSCILKFSAKFNTLLKDIETHAHIYVYKYIYTYNILYEEYMYNILYEEQCNGNDLK